MDRPHENDPFLELEQSCVPNSTTCSTNSMVDLLHGVVRGAELKKWERSSPKHPLMLQPHSASKMTPATIPPWGYMFHHRWAIRNNYPNWSFFIVHNKDQTLKTILDSNSNLKHQIRVPVQIRGANGTTMFSSTMKRYQRVMNFT